MYEKKKKEIMKKNINVTIIQVKITSLPLPHKCLDWRDTLGMFGPIQRQKFSRNIRKQEMGCNYASLSKKHF
jgi:hypothetical protein